MRFRSLLVPAAMLTGFFQVACEKPAVAAKDDSSHVAASAAPDMQRRISEYTTVTLAADTSTLTVKERQMLPLLIDAARAMDPRVYWMQTYGTAGFAVVAISDPAAKLR